MGLVIAIYTKEAFKEYIFPAINNADYSLTLGKNTFNLRKDISLEFEVINDVWKLKPGKDYHTFRHRFYIQRHQRYVCAFHL